VPLRHGAPPQNTGPDAPQPLGGEDK
jgi:hypothetical protein